MAAKKLKTNFRVESRISAFYTGGKVQLSSDGQFLFCVHGAIVNILDTTSGKVVHSIKEEDCDDVTCFAVTPDDKYLVVAHRNMLLKQWEWEEERCVRTWKAIHSAPVVSMTFDPTATLLATGSSDGTIKLWDIVQQYCTHNLKGSQGVVSVVRFHPDADKLLLFSTSDDCKIRVWDLRTSRCRAVLESHYSAVTSFAFSAGGQTMYSSGRDNIVVVWDLDSYCVKKTIPVYEPLESVLLPLSGFKCGDFEVGDDTLVFVTAGAQGLLKVWDATTAKCLYTQRHQAPPAQPQQPHDHQAGGREQQIVTHISKALLCSVSKVIVVVTYDHNILLVGLEDLELKKQFVGYNEEILDVRFMGEAETHIAVASNSEQIRVFELSSHSCQILVGHTDIVLALDVFKSGLLLASTSKDNTVRLWRMDPTSGRVQGVALGIGHTHSVGTVVAARSSKFFVSGSEDCTIKVWGIPTDLPLDKDAPPAHLLVRFTEHAHDKDINSVAVSPNDKLLATGSQDRTAKLWHLEKQVHLGSFRGHRRGIWCVQFSPVDQALATSSADGTIKIWAISDFTCVKTFEGHDASVLSIEFLSRGMQLISCGSDGLLKLWTIKTNECVKTLDEHTQKIWALAVNREQDIVISGGGDSNIVIWKDVTEIELEEELVKEEHQILKEQELSNLLHQKKYLKAIGLAITLNQPFRVLGIIKTVLDEPNGRQNLETTMKKMRPDQLESMLGFCKHWNTNAKHCHAAQTVISIIIRSVSMDDLLTYPTMQQTLESLIPYTERHFERMNRLLQQSMFVEYTWQKMRRAISSTGQDELAASSYGEGARSEGTGSGGTLLYFDTRPSKVNTGDDEVSSSGEEEKTPEADLPEDGDVEHDSDEENGDADKVDGTASVNLARTETLTKGKLRKRTVEKVNGDKIVSVSPYKADTSRPQSPKQNGKRRRGKTESTKKSTPQIPRKRGKNIGKRSPDCIGSDGTADEVDSDERGRTVAVRTRSKAAKRKAAGKESPSIAAKKRVPSSARKLVKKSKVSG